MTAKVSDFHVFGSLVAIFFSISEEKEEKCFLFHLAWFRGRTSKAMHIQPVGHLWEPRANVRPHVRGRVGFSCTVSTYSGSQRNVCQREEIRGKCRRSARTCMVTEPVRGQLKGLRFFPAHTVWTPPGLLRGGRTIRKKTQDLGQIDRSFLSMIVFFPHLRERVDSPTSTQFFPVTPCTLRLIES